jgi:hypothetical protein
MVCPEKTGYIESQNFYISFKIYTLNLQGCCCVAVKFEFF